MSSKLVDAALEANESVEAQPAAHGVRAILAPFVALAAVFLAHLFVSSLSEPGHRWWDQLPMWRHPYPNLLAILLVVAVLLAMLYVCWPRVRSWVRHNAPLLAGVVVLLGLWDVITHCFDRSLLIFFPTPNLVFGSMVEDWEILLRSTRQSLVLLLCGYVSGIVAGISTGILIGWFPSVRYWAMPAMKVIGPIPATALIAFVMTMSTQAFVGGVMLIAFVVWFPVTMLTSSGISSVRLSHLDVARTLGAGPLYLIFRVALPSALPNIFLGLFMGLLASFLTLVVAETVGVEAGLGHYFLLVQGDVRYDKMYAALLIMALFCSGLMTALFRIRDWMLRWQQGVLKW